MNKNIEQDSSSQVCVSVFCVCVYKCVAVCALCVRAVCCVLCAVCVRARACVIVFVRAREYAQFATCARRSTSRCTAVVVLRCHV